MGGVIFLDTSFIIAFFNEEDENHDDARMHIRQTLEKDNLIKFFFTDYIFDEVITMFKIRGVPSELISTIGETMLKSSLWKLIKITEVDFHNTWKMIKKYSDKAWSFTDVNSFVIMDFYKIPYYLSYDTHFAEYSKIKPWQI
jgi:predicted nucleic acid-binding protein